jgi:hypothetical protein
MTLAVDVDVAPMPKSPGTKAAVEYLVASGATAITIVEHDGCCSFQVGRKIDPRAVSIHWLPETNARAIVRQARRDAGDSPDVATAASVLAQAAADHRAVPTPHHVAMTRAGDAANRIEQHMDFLRRTGKLRGFTRMYKRRRTVAAANGQGFMTYKVAEMRLRRALIPQLVGGQNAGPMHSLFAEIFDR